MQNPVPKKVKIAFIADDDPEDIDMLREVISELDNTVDFHIFPDGRAVLAQLRACKDQELPHFLILDYNMPEFSGWQVLKEIRHNMRYSGILKYVFSTSAVTIFKEECLSAGAAAYFVKPSSFNELRNIAEQMLTGRIDPKGPKF